MNYQTLYTNVQKGMNKEKVISIMKEPPKLVFQEKNRKVLWWDDEKINKTKEMEISETIVYSVDTFFLPVTFEFSFDLDGNIIGKHKYD